MCSVHHTLFCVNKRATFDVTGGMRREVQVRGQLAVSDYQAAKCFIAGNTGADKGM
jgi:isopentenyl phosphate kinase